MIANAICAGCGCFCDDIELRFQSDEIIECKNACELGVRYFQSPTNQITSALVGGEQANVEDAVAAACNILCSARSPAIIGLDRLTCEAQRRALELARLTRATVRVSDECESRDKGSAFASVGLVTCTLGELKQRADFVLLWDVDPNKTHPRFIERYLSASMPRKFVALGEQTPSAVEIDQFITCEPARQLDFLLCARASLAGKVIDEKAWQATGVDPKAVTLLIEKITKANWGVLLFSGESEPARNRVFFESLFSFVRDVNDHTCFVALELPAPGNRAGAENILAWQTGFTSAVNFENEFPSDMVVAHSGSASSCVDAVLVFENELTSDHQTNTFGDSTKVIRIGNTPARDARCDVFLPTRLLVDTPGTVFRLDEVPLELRPARVSTLPTSEQILQQLVSAVRNCQATLS